MSLREQIYSVLIVSSSETINKVLSQLLSESRCHPVRIVSSVSAAKMAWHEQSYDFVIVNSPLPDDAGIRFSIDISAAAGVVVLVLVRSDFYGDVREKAATNGVYTLSKPLSRSMLGLSLDWMKATRERFRILEKKAISVEEKMAEIRLVNRAKWLLISQLKMDEPQAHRYIERQAMDQCIPKRKVAEEIIKTYS